MPTFTSPIQNVYTAIDRPCVDQVVQGLINEGILLQPSRYVHPDTVVTVRKRSADGIYYPGELTLTVEPLIEAVEQADWALKNRWLYLPPLFRDTALAVSLYPMIIDYQATVRLTYTDENIESLRKLRESLLIKRQFGWYGSNHTLQYTLLPSKETDELMRIIHALREKVHGYGHSYAEWCTLYANPDFHPVVGGQHTELAYAASQMEIEGNLEGDIEPIEEFTTSVYSFSFTYKFRYARPSAIVASFPIQIHQQLLPRQYTVTVNKEHENYAILDMPIIRGLTYASASKKVGIRIPCMDTFPIRSMPSGYQPIFTALLAVDDVPVEELVLCVLDQIEDIVLHPDILRYLKAIGYQTMTQPYANLFLLTLHRDDNIMDSRYLTVDNALSIGLSVPINLRYTYRLSFSVLTQLQALTSSVLLDMKPYHLDTILADTVNELAQTGGTMSEVINYPLIPKDLTNVGYLRTVAPLIDIGVDSPWREEPRNLVRIPKGVTGFRSVQTSWVTAIRKD